MALISTSLGLLALILGIFARPERHDVVRGIGEFAVALAGSLVLFGYFIPMQLFTVIDAQTWTHAIPRLVGRTLPMVFGLVIVLAIAGAASILGSAAADAGASRVHPSQRPATKAAAMPAGADATHWEIADPSRRRTHCGSTAPWSLRVHNSSRLVRLEHPIEHEGREMAIAAKEVRIRSPDRLHRVPEVSGDGRDRRTGREHRRRAPVP